MTENGKFTPPKSSSDDVIHTVAKAGLGSIPLVGAAASELFNFFITPPLEKRRRKWMETVGKALDDLEKNHGIKIEELKEDEAFIDTVLKASSIAIKHSQKEKQNALLNAVKNTALPNPLDESTRQIFLNLVDSFTVWHLKVLKFFQDPKKWAEANSHSFPNYASGAPSTMLENGFQELRGNRIFYDQVWRDLFLSGLVGGDTLHMTMTKGGMMASRTTELGNEFLNFIEDEDS